MGDLLSNALAAILVVAVLAFLVFAGFRLGVRFLVRRLVGLVFVVLGVTFITFILGYFAPGNAAYTQLGQHYSKEAYAPTHPLLWAGSAVVSAIRQLPGATAPFRSRLLLYQ